MSQWAIDCRIPSSPLLSSSSIFTKTESSLKILESVSSSRSDISSLVSRCPPIFVRRDDEKEFSRWKKGSCALKAACSDCNSARRRMTSGLGSGRPLSPRSLRSEALGLRAVPIITRVCLGAFAIALADCSILWWMAVVGRLPLRRVSVTRDLERLRTRWGVAELGLR